MSIKGFDKLFNKLDSIGLFSITLKNISDHVVSYSNNGSEVPFIPTDDGISYYFEIKNIKISYIFEVSNPKSNYNDLVKYFNLPQNQSLIKEIKVFIDAVDMLRQELNIEF